MTAVLEEAKLTRKDFVPPVDVRWCPGCGDYAILNAVQKVFPALGIPKEKFVVVSGIGCSSRFPYYMNTYGFHSVHGRAPTVATGIKVANPDLSVWLITGDGDGLSIGGNHLMHILRRNLDVNILLFNNKIYGLTKGQYSPTSEVGKVTKSSPLGSLDTPINPLCFALAAEATFVARTMDTNPKHMADVFEAAARHKGTSFVEIFQNCVIFNDDAWEGISGREVRDDRLIMMEEGKPLLFGKEKNKGLRIRSFKPEIVTLGENGVTEADLFVHDCKNTDPTYAYMLTQMSYPHYPTPMGIFRAREDRPTYEQLLRDQIKTTVQMKGRGVLADLLRGNEYWEVKSKAEGETTAVPIVKKAPETEETMIMRERRKQAGRLQDEPILRVLKSRIDVALNRYGSDTILSLGPKDSLTAALKMFKKHQIGCIPILEGDDLVGILSERDILLKVVLKSVDRDHTPVSQIMTHHPETLNYWNTIGDAINKLSVGGFRHLPVRSKNGNVGLISVKGLVNFIHETIHS